MTRPLLALLLMLAPLLAAGTPLEAQTRSEGAVASLESLLDVERVLLEEQLRRLEQARTSRTAAMGRLTRLYRSLDAALMRDDDEGATRPPAPDYELLVNQLSEAEGERVAAFAVERDALVAMRDRLRRIALLEEQRDEQLGRRPAEPSGALSGSWSLSMLPIDQRGSWTLTQRGAVVDGTYELDGGWSGSLQGTLVNRKVFLVRIDSKLGKVMEYEGFLSADGETIRGTWLNYELAGAEGSTGHFAAERSDDGR